MVYKHSLLIEHKALLGQHNVARENCDGSNALRGCSDLQRDRYSMSNIHSPPLPERGLPWCSIGVNSRVLCPELSTTRGCDRGQQSKDAASAVFGHSSQRTCPHRVKGSVKTRALSGFDIIARRRKPRILTSLSGCLRNRGRSPDKSINGGWPRPANRRARGPHMRAH